MILRFATDLAVGFTSHAYRNVRPVKVQQRNSGGTWRTLQGLADFTVVQSYLSTAWRSREMGNQHARRTLSAHHYWTLAAVSGQIAMISPNLTQAE